MQLFENFKSTSPSKDIDFPTLAEIIKTDSALKSATLWYHELTDAQHPTEAKQRKESTPQVAIAFRMEGGKGLENCKECLHYSFVDFDDKDSKVRLPKSQLEEIFNTLSKNHHGILGYKSISGRGYHLIVEYRLPDGIVIDMEKDPVYGAELYKRVHRYINRYYTGLTRQKMDELCGNANRMVGLAWDPGVTYNPTADPFSLTRHDLDIDDDGNLIKYRKLDKRTKVDICAEGNFEQAVLFLQEKGMEFVQGQRHDFLVRLSFLLNRMGVKEDEAADAIDEKYGKEYKDEKPSYILRNCYRHATDEHGILANKGKGGRKGSNEKIKTELVANYLKDKPLRYDIIKRCVEIGDPPQPSLKREGEEQEVSDSEVQKVSEFQEVSNGLGSNLWVELRDRDINDMIVECCKETGENITERTFRTVLNSSVIPAVNPLHEYLKSLSPWDESMEDFIGQCAGMVHVANEGNDGTQETPNTEVSHLWTECFRKWFVAMVASWIDEKVVNHQVIVLIGEQGIYKTTWLDNLLPPELDKYKSKQTAMDRLDKDEQLRAAEYALINLDEIDKLSERGLNELKSIITTTQIDVRAPYGYGKEKRRRIASYVASGNKEQFLTDMTGNRRWLPFKVVSIDSPYENDIPYAGMYAQALYLIKNGYNYWFSLEDTSLLSSHVEGFMVESNEEQLINVYFAPAKRGQQDAQLLTVAEISSKLIGYGNIRNPLNVRQLGVVLKKLGYEQIRLHNSRRGYLVIERSSEDLKAQRRLDAR